MNYPYYNYQNPFVQAPQQNQGLNWVQGETGAKSWMVGRGETVLLMDSENPVFYLKSSDQAGMPLPLRIFDYKERVQDHAQGSQNAQTKSLEQFVTRDEFDELKAELKGIAEEMQKKPTRKKEVSADE